MLDKSFLPGATAIMVPHTDDGRVMFAIPWHDHTLVGTTDFAVDEPSLEPVPMDHEIDFLLGTAGRYLHKKPTRSDVLSAFAGIRPLAGAGSRDNTALLSRDHSIHIDHTGLLSITGGKWTTYRNMAEDCVNQAATLGDLPERDCLTRTLNLHGYHPNAASLGSLAVYGADAGAIRRIGEKSPELASPLDPALPTTGAEIVWAAREEMARTVEDALARRTRALLLDARAAIRMAPRVAALMARELGRDAGWQARQVAAFTEVARGYQVAP